MSKNELTIGVITEIVPKNYKKLVTQDVVDEINLLTKDPDYGEEFKESFLSATSVLSGKTSVSLLQYIAAVKYYSLTASGMTFTDAYIKVFPERLQARLDRGEDKTNMGGEASRYNATDTVTTIRRQALVPLHLVNQGAVQTAINALTNIVLNGKSEMAKVAAATTLIKELRPPETQHVELQLGLSEEAREAQKKQHDQLIEIAENQRRLLAAGANINDIQRLHITTTIIEEDEDE